MDLTVGNLIGYSAQVLVVVATGAMGALCLRTAAARARLACWRGIVVVCLVLPLFPTRISHVVFTEPAALQVAAGDFAVEPAAAADGSAVRLSPGEVVATLLVAGAGARAAWILLGLLALSRLRRRSRPAALPDDIEVLRRGVAPRAAIRWHEGVGQPVTFGWWRPVVLLPESLQELPIEAQRAVVCHELLHVRRGDWAWMLVDEAIKCLFWFHPAMRYALAQLQLSREQLVDEEVVRITAAKQAYMNALVMFAGGDSRSVAVAAPFIRPRHLRARIRQLSEERSMSRLRIAGGLVVSLLFVTGSAWLAAATLPLQAREVTFISTPMPPSSPVAGSAMPQPASIDGGSSGEQRSQAALERARLARAALEMRLAAQRVREAQASAQTPVVTPRRTTQRVAPEYPLELRTYGVESVVTLHVVVNADGQIRDVDVVRTRVVTTRDIDDPAYWTSQPSRIFAQAAEAAAERWEFAPAADATTVELAFVFVPRQATAGYLIGNPGETRVSLSSETPVTAGASPTPSPATSAPAAPAVVGSAVPGAVPSSPDPVQPAMPVRLRVGGQIRQPTKILTVPPEYPAAAKAARVAGVVIVEAVIGTDGSVSETAVLRSIPLLDQAAVDAVRQWRYMPTLLNGQPVELIMTVTVNFTVPPEQ